MIGELQQFEDASNSASRNKYRLFQRTAGKTDCGVDRAFSGTFPDIALNPKFKIQRGSTVFTIGSCFARTVEQFLARADVHCPTIDCIIPDELYERTGIGARNGALNAYTPRSMLALLNWRSHAERDLVGALDVGEGKWIDMLVTGLRVLNRDELNLARGKILQTYAQLPKASTVVVTLGYTESWYDQRDKIWVNASPAGRRASMRHADRYKFMNASAADCYDALVHIIRNIRAQTDGKANIIFTVSPVPFHGTFTNRDVILANQYSKSTLLSTAVMIADRYDYVDYFPSYEMATMAPRELVWMEDGLHVKTSFVEQIMKRFTSGYISD
jgi:hypothetical protein